VKTRSKGAFDDTHEKNYLKLNWAGVSLQATKWKRS